MVFGLSHVEKAADAAVAVIAPMFALARIGGFEIKAEALRNPYILGLLSTLISFEGMIATGKMTHGDASGKLFMLAWPRITDDNGEGIGQLLYDYAISKNREFNDGADNAVKVTQIVHGKPYLEYPEVAEAVEAAKSLPLEGMPENNSRGEFEARMKIPNTYYAPAAFLLWNKLFVERLHALSD